MQLKREMFIGGEGVKAKRKPRPCAVCGTIE